MSHNDEGIVLPPSRLVLSLLFKINAQLSVSYSLSRLVPM